MAIGDKDSQDTLQWALNTFFGTLKHVGIEVSPDETNNLIRELFNTYKEYQNCYPVRVKAHDIYKIFAWSPYILCEIKQLSEDEKDKVIATAVHHLRSLLLRNRLEVDEAWVDKLILLARNGLRPELENISIGKIGLYTAFKTTFHIKTVTAISASLSSDSTEETLDTLFGIV